MRVGLQAFAGATLVAALAIPGPAMALTSVEGSTLGDQGYYWRFGSESWVFPHGIVNVDNRAMVQYVYGSSSAALEATALTHQNILSGNLEDTNFYNITGPQAAEYSGGLIVELVDGLNLGFWFAEYAPLLGGPSGFVNRGISRTGWAHSTEPLTVDDIRDLGLDIQTNTNGLTGNPFDAGRKLDFFAAYAIPDAGLEAGLHIWWGSDTHTFLPDDSVGPVDIDPDSDPGDLDTNTNLGTANQEDLLESKYRLTDLGIGLGAGYAGIPGLRIDFGFDLNFLGVAWQPNGINEYLDAGGTGFAVNARGLYELSDGVTLGAFIRYGRDSRGFEPKLQRDGGDLREAATIDDYTDDELTNIPSPPAQRPQVYPPSDPSPDPADDLAPVAGFKYQEVQSDFQFTFLAKYVPNSRAAVYGGLGFAMVSASDKLSLGNEWIDEHKATIWATPSFHLGAMGKVTEYLDVSIGATRRWQQHKRTDHAFDDRIPDNTDTEAPTTGQNPPAGNEDYTNANRRDIETKTSWDVSHTKIMVGSRFHVSGLQFVTQIDPKALFAGPFFLTGQVSTADEVPIVWFSLIYDWDYDKDTAKAGGNGEHRDAVSPHKAEPAMKKPAKTAPSYEEEEEEEEEIFDS